MANKLYEETSIQSIATAIRQKNGLSTKYKVGEMAQAVKDIPSGSGSQKEEYHQCPENVRNFIANVTYDPSDYSTSQIETYLTNTPADAYPIGKTVDGVTYYNFVPNIETPFASGNSAGTIKPLDFLRQIKAGSSSQNIRDLGGWNCDGGKVKYGKIFRGGEFSSTDADTIRILRDLGIRAQLDLRGTEDDLTSSPLGSDVDFCKPTGTVDATYWAGYRLDDTDAMREAFKFIFDSVAKDRPLYFHCSAGADRTGTIACLIEGLLGLSQSDCDKDYEITSFLGSGYVRKRTGTSSLAGESRGYKKLIEEITALTVGTTFRDKIANYIATLGFTADEINAFRASMIDGTPDTITISLEDCDIVDNTSNVTFSNSASSVKKYSPYINELTVPDGYVIHDLQVKMNGEDVTDQFVEADEKVWYHAVTENLTNCSGNASHKNVADGGTYALRISVDSGYTMKSVIVTHEGTDVTSSVYKDGVIIINKVSGDVVVTAIAEKPTVAYTVTNNLTNVTNSNKATSVGSGSAYTATLTATSGYTISSVKITMGGTDVSSSYSNGTINISSVTGNIVITATAVEDTPAYTDVLKNAINMAGTKIGKTWMYTNKRYNSSSGNPIDETGSYITGLFAAKVGDIIRMRIPKNSSLLTNTENTVKFFKSDRAETKTGKWSFVKFGNNGAVGSNNFGEVLVSDIPNGKFDFKVSDASGVATGMAYVTFCTNITSDINNIVIAVNEEIPD